MFCNEWYNLSAQVDCLEETLEKSLQAKESPDLRVSILLDYTRGSRGRYYDALLSLKACSIVVPDVLSFLRERLPWLIGPAGLNHVFQNLSSCIPVTARSQKIFRMSSFFKGNRCLAQ